MLFLCRFLTFFIYIFLLQILASCNLYLWPLLSISSVGSWLGRTAPCSRTRTRSRSTTVTANPPRFGHTTFPHLSTYLLLAWFDSTDFLFICLFFTPYILRKIREWLSFPSPGTTSLRRWTVSVRRKALLDQFSQFMFEIFQETTSCVEKAVPVCKSKPVTKCTTVSGI